jgi:hypothetical protein
MVTYSDKPNVRVTVSGIPSACNADCTYTFLNNVPTITALSLSGYKLSFTINDPSSLNPPLNDLTIILNNQKCTNLIGTFSSFTCDLPINTDNTPILVAGTYLPSVTVLNLG